MEVFIEAHHIFGTELTVRLILQKVTLESRFGSLHSGLQFHTHMPNSGWPPCMTAHFSPDQLPLFEFGLLVDCQLEIPPIILIDFMDPLLIILI